MSKLLKEQREAMKRLDTALDQLFTITSKLKNRTKSAKRKSYVVDGKKTNSTNMSQTLMAIDHGLLEEAARVARLSKKD